MRTVRIRNRPADEVEVTEAEYTDLVRQGLVEPQEDKTVTTKKGKNSGSDSD